MKMFFKAGIFLGLCIFLAACRQSTDLTASPVSSPTDTGTATLIPPPSITPFTKITPTDNPDYVPPTLIPTIDPILVPELLSKAFSVQTIADLNGHKLKLRQITGWDYGFGGGFLYTSCIGYVWLDTSHFLLYPATGQVDLPEGWSPTKFNVVRQPVIINVDNGHVWLPPVKAPTSPETCDTIEWSSELGILILPEDQDGNSTISTYSFDGRKLANYSGRLLDVSPSGTKFLLNDNTLIDLRTNTRITLTGSLEYYSEEFYDLFWTSDETRIYRCCYFYADLTTGTSYSSARSDFQNISDDHEEPWLVYRGAWIQNDAYFLPDWSWLDDGDIRYLPILDPAKKMVLEVRAKSGIPEDWSCTEIDASPDGKYVWMTGFGDSYLVDLTTFDAQYYPRSMYSDVDWSLNSKFVWLHNNDLSDETEPYSILSVIDKELKSLPVAPLSEWIHWWHPSDDILIYPAEDDNALILLDVFTMSFRELPFKVNAGGYDSLVWSPSGDKIAFVSENGSIWQVDYPNLENPEQLTPPLPQVNNVDWSSDGRSIAFISASDIYVVEVTK